MYEYKASINYRGTTLAFYIDEQTEDNFILLGENEAYYFYDESDVDQSIYFYDDYSRIMFNSGSSYSGTDGCVTQIPFLMQLEVAD